ncbi:copper resistance CopC family protein [Nonomuraea rhizosphaerae]|uniref:copper resistance CopC family protein n=1 Tax=Nonomuraea rhizosphaerae TaxID=2665663 RepID=UPI001C5E6EEF|nr:copper resistance CopC family protein [Nonomuraea rhizosphaerae]
MKTSPSAALTALLAALFLLGTAGPALAHDSLTSLAHSSIEGLAHDSLKSSVPAKGATVVSPSEVKLEFISGVRQPFVVVSGPEDRTYQNGDAKVGGKVVTQELRDVLPDGDYTIAYRVVSSDGHPVQGEIPFTVAGAPSTTAPSAVDSAAPSAPEETDSAAAVPTAVPTPTRQTPVAEPAAAASTSFPVWLLVVVGGLVGIGIGFLLSARKGSKRR